MRRIVTRIGLLALVLATGCEDRVRLRIKVETRDAGASVRAPATSIVSSSTLSGAPAAR